MLKIIKAETSLGSDNKGTEQAPEVLLRSGLVDALKHHKINHEILKSPKITRLSETKDKSHVKNHAALTLLNRSIYEMALTSPASKDKILLLGGDHSMSIGSMFATKKSHPNAVLIYIDAHPDCNNPDSSPSGNMHGMSLSTVLGDSLYDDYKFKKYKYNEVVIIGAKDIDPYERHYLKEKKIKVHTIEDIVSDGIGKIMKSVLKFAEGKPVHISLDIDCVDVSEAPGTGIINKGGLTYREIKYVTERLSTLDTKSIDLMEINPKKDKEDKTIALGIELILNLLGGKWSPYEKYLENHSA